MGGKAKNENVKIEKKDGSHYYIANQDLKKLDFVDDNVICFIGSIRNCPCIFSIKYNNGGYGNIIYLISNDINENTEKLGSIIKAKEFIARNILN